MPPAGKEAFRMRKQRQALDLKMSGAGNLPLSSEICRFSALPNPAFQWLDIS